MTLPSWHSFVETRLTLISNLASQRSIVSVSPKLAPMPADNYRKQYMKYNVDIYQISSKNAYYSDKKYLLGQIRLR